MQTIIFHVSHFWWVIYLPMSNSAVIFILHLVHLICAIHQFGGGVSLLQNNALCTLKVVIRMGLSIIFVFSSKIQPRKEGMKKGEAKHFIACPVFLWSSVAFLLFFFSTFSANNLIQFPCACLSLLPLEYWLFLHFAH